MKKKDDISVIPATRELSCVLSEPELLAYSRDQSRLLTDRHELEEKKKEVAAEYTSKIKSLDAGINVLTRKIITGSEMRDVKCEVTMRWQTGKKDTVRLDTKELVNTEDIREGERQQRMTFNKEEQAESAKAPYGIWDGTKFLKNDDGDRYETTTVKAGHVIRKALDAQGAKNLMVISIAAAPLKETIGKQTEAAPGASGGGD